jgi:DNA-binding MarR family transcriptional regulator
VEQPVGEVRSTAAAEAWGLLQAFFLRHRHLYMEAAVRHGLNPGSMQALLSLDPDRPKPMGSLAGEWKCDASNVTWLVDRLEERGLVRRQISALDRRVKTVVLTESGIDTATAIRTQLAAPPPALERLSDEELADLRAVMEKLQGP